MAKKCEKCGKTLNSHNKMGVCHACALRMLNIVPGLGDGQSRDTIFFKRVDGWFDESGNRWASYLPPIHG